MKAIMFRLLVSAAGLGVGSLIFPGSVSGVSLLPAAIMLTILYIFLRPALLVVALLPNMFLMGLLTPLADALFICWTGAWVNGMAVGYWQAVALAAIMSCLYYPYSLYRKRKLGGVANNAVA